MLNVVFPARHSLTRGVTTMAAMASSGRSQKGEGDISAVFASLRPDDAVHAFPPRFADLKRAIWEKSTGSLEQSWKEVLGELELETKHIRESGEQMIPQISIDAIHRGLSAEESIKIREAGCVVVKGAVSQKIALEWKLAIQQYAAVNADKVKGFPADKIQVYELYNTVSQMQARTHPNILATQRALLSLWHTSSDDIRLDAPISYFDRLRIRFPGDMKFALGPHADAGSIERWEDLEYRKCFSKILDGGSSWRNYDPYFATPRVNAKQDLYHAPNQCSIFRPWQGWTSMSNTGPGQGTLQLLPSLRLATAYWILRPFFRPRDPTSPSLKFENWNVPDVDNPNFVGAGMGTGLELNNITHPHLKLAETMVSVPMVEPGDQVYWHCDMIHAVEARHGGVQDSSVLYIPAVPLTADNAHYLRDQRNNFLAGLPAPDFPGGSGESDFVGRATEGDVHPQAESQQAMGFRPFVGNGQLLREANAILGYS
ncbi:Duf1479 domain protein [Mycena indigotica]|uniref:Duf1479 domain protein n=1 Tax=Mycena indigotica TaxID=2126181 RepID=A0A8H6T434_9AGAR|nr:Duf1479 domain protein [Mycena indigotica]KAF7309866.1 Duf1479 domain protein [Mycena indigotica]